MRRMTNKWLLLAIVGLLSCVALTSMAQPPSEGEGGRRGQQEGRRPGPPPRGGPEGGPGRGFGGPPPIMAALDADHDGELSAKEIEAAAKSLRTLDKNEDGKLTREELFHGRRGPGERPPIGREGRGRPEGRGFGQPPRDREEAGPREGRGEEREFGPRGRRPEFEPGDRPQRPEFRPGGPERGGPEGGPRGEGRRPGGFGGSEFVARIREFDKNDDGKVSREELPERMQRVLDRADTNKDDALDEQELKRMAAAMAAGRGARPEGRPGSRPEGEAGGDRPRRPPLE